MHDRHAPPAGPGDPLLQPVCRTTHRLQGRGGPGKKLPANCSFPRPIGPGSSPVCAQHWMVLPSARSRARSVCRDGRLRVMLRNIRCLPDYDGSPALLIVDHDITELKAAQERALNSERMAAIGQTCAGLAHESRNALQRSQACLEMLALKLVDRPDTLGPDRPDPASPRRPAPALRRRARVCRPDQARASGLRSGGNLATGVVASRAAARRQAGYTSRATLRLEPDLPGRPVPAGAGVPQHPRQRASARDDERRRHRDHGLCRQARRPRRRSASPSGTTVPA